MATLPGWLPGIVGAAVLLTAYGVLGRSRVCFELVADPYLRVVNGRIRCRDCAGYTA
jgi:hypothetical protein